MAKGGKKYTLVLYHYILDRWWPSTFMLAMLLFIIVGFFWGFEYYFSTYQQGDMPLPRLSTAGGVVLIGVGGVALLLTLFLLVARKLAYVQLFDTYLRLATPFLRMNIAYKRIHKTTTAQVSNLFPPKKFSGTSRDILSAVAGETAIVIHLTALPLPRASLRLFLSPFFFYDNTPHIVLIVDNWMKFNVEFDSRRMGAKTRTQPPKPKMTSGLLDDLTRK